MLTYSNGWGHFGITIAVIMMATFLIYTGKLDTSAATGLLGAVISFWFMSGSVNRFASPSQAAQVHQQTAPQPAVIVNQNPPQHTTQGDPQQ